MTPAPALLAVALQRMGLAAPAETILGQPLTGGVSSDIWRVDLPAGPICVKRALPKLRVAADWEAPVERSAYEARWMRQAAAAVSAAAPALLGEADGCIAMAYLSPDDHALWKSELSRGRADPGFGASVGGILAKIHSVTAATPSLAAQFDSAAIFHAIRLEPYLLATAAAHPDRADVLRSLVATYLANTRAMIHGDVSPKNILVGPNGPVFLDAECATWGDPAFDLAFCLNHLLLKCLWVPRAAPAFLSCFDALAAAYAAGIDWEPAAVVEARAARLLPGLLLARVDGKSPVEYITTDADRAVVRRVGRALLAVPVDTLAGVRAAWERGLRS